MHTDGACGVDENMSEESADLGAMRESPEENSSGLFCPMGLRTQLVNRSVLSTQPIQPGQPGYNVPVAPMAPIQPTTRRSIGPIQTPRHISVQCDDNIRLFDTRREDNVRGLDAMREDMPHMRSPNLRTNSFNQANQCIQNNQTNQPNLFNQTIQTSLSNQFNIPSLTPSRATSLTLETTMSDSRKRKRENISTHPSITDIMKNLERIDQQQNLDIASRDSEIMRLKLQLSDMRSIDDVTAGEQRVGQTMAQSSAALQLEVVGLKKVKMESEYRLRELEEELRKKEEELQAADSWHTDKEVMEEKYKNMTNHLTSAQEQVSRFMDAFNREAANRNDLVKKLESQERFNVKLSKDLKKKNEEVRMGGEGRERYVKLAGAVRGLFGHVEMQAMSGEAFGDVGKALKRVRDLVMEGDGVVGGGGGGK